MTPESRELPSSQASGHVLATIVTDLSLPYRKTKDTLKDKLMPKDAYTLPVNVFPVFWGSHGEFSTYTDKLITETRRHEYPRHSEVFW